MLDAVLWLCPIPFKIKHLWQCGGIRYFLCKRIFKKCGKHVNIERQAYFAFGIDIEIGDYSGIGIINAHIPNGTIIGDYVMMGPNCLILDVNHDISDTTRPMCQQGMTEKKITKIYNDMWIGRDVHMTRVELFQMVLSLR